MPKQNNLPGLEDRRIADLHEAAEEYVKYRDKRQELTTKEVELKQELLRLMHKHKKTEYRCDGVEVSIVMEEETVKVKLVPVKDEN